MVSPDWQRILAEAEADARLARELLRPDLPPEPTATHIPSEPDQLHRHIASLRDRLDRLHGQLQRELSAHRCDAHAPVAHYLDRRL